MVNVLTKQFMETGEHMNFWKLWLEFDAFDQSLEDINYEETGYFGFKIDCLKSYSETIKRGERFLSDMLPITFEKFPSDDTGTSTKAEWIAKLRNLIERMINNIDDDTQKFVFAFTTIEQIYDQHLIQRKKFTFSQANSELDRRPTLHYDIFLPFWKKDYKTSDRPCLYSSADLPLYFHLPHDKLDQ